MTPELPPGSTARPATMDDARAVYEVHAACERAAYGIVDVALEDVIAEWSQPSLDLSRNTILVLDGDRVIGRAEALHDFARVNVHPDRRGEGIGSWLLAWTEQRARDTGVPGFRQIIHVDDAPAIELLVRHGFEPLYDSWLLEIGLEGQLSEPRLPDGYSFRDFDVERDARACYDVIQDAFSEWPDHHRPPYDDWAATSIHAAEFEPWHMIPILREDRIVGVAWLIDYPDAGWVQSLAVERAHRGRGLGRALLERAFAVYAGRGRAKAGLSTDSRTGMLSLYEHVGMTVARSFRSYGKRAAPSS